jgi:DNA-binding MarR family transcriptional regulator
MSPPENAAATRVLRRFRVIFNAVKTHFQQVERRAGIGGAQLWALAVVRAEPGIGISGVARAMDIHPSTASNLVRGLVALRLLATERSTADGRAVALRLLPAGTRLLRKAPGPFAGVLPQALGGLDDATLERLDADLGRLLHALDVLDERAPMPPSRTAKPRRRHGAGA